MTDLEAAISRLEQAAAVWFNQDLHRDLRMLIVAARAKAIESSRPVTYSVLERDVFNRQIPAWRAVSHD